MKVKESIIRQSIDKAKSEIAKIDEILNATPLSDLIRLEIETITKAKDMDAGSKDVLIYLDAQIKKRDALRKMAEKQKNSLRLVERKARLSLELGELNSELFYIEMR